jgi:hypothetical protein
MKNLERDLHLPEKLEFYIGPLDCGDFFEIQLQKDALWYSSGAIFEKDRKNKICAMPDRDRWLAFWQDIERLGVWDWKEDYSDPLILDGGCWSLEIERRGRTLKSGGKNGYPGCDGPEYPDDSAFGRFVGALRRLTGIEEI